MILSFFKINEDMF